MTPAGAGALGEFVETLEASRSRATVARWARAFARFVSFAVSAGLVPRDWCAWLQGRPSVPAGVFSAFALDLKRRGLAAATIDKEWGALGAALRLLGVSTPLSTLDEIFRQGVRAGRAPPSEAVPGLPVSRLMLAVLRLPSRSPLERRDRLLVAMAIAFGARPVDLTRVARSDSRFATAEHGVLRLRFLRDKSSQLSGSVVSRWLHFFSTPEFPIVDWWHEVVSDVQRTRIRAVPAPGGVLFHPLFVCLDSHKFGEPLDVDTISHILRRFLAPLGVSPRQAQARMIRSFSASSAYELGVPVDEVCRHFRWKDPGTFLSHYHRWDVELPISIPEGPRDGSRVSLAFGLALHRLQGSLSV
jgi:hypothetical protein